MTNLSLPRQFLAFGNLFVYDNIFSWYTSFQRQQLIVSIIDISTEEEKAYTATIYHETDVIDQAVGKTPLLACLNAKLHFYLESINHVNFFLDSINEEQID